MTMVNGTPGQDFIHVSGDGRIAPPGYNEVAFTPDGFVNFIDPGAGADILYGSEVRDLLVVSNSSDISGLAEYFDGGSGLDSVILYADGVIDLTSISLVSVESVILSNEAGTESEVVLSAAQIMGFDFIAASSISGSSSVIDLSEPGHVIVSAGGTQLLYIDRFNGTNDEDLFDITTVLTSGLALNGAGGDDTIYLSAIDDHSSAESLTLLGGDGNDVLRGGRGVFTMDGGTGRDTLTGGAKGDTLGGGRGADTLTGGRGADLLAGDGGADTFVFKSIKDSTSAKSDTIADFNQARGDRIDLHKIDADAAQSGDQAFRLAAGGAFTGHAGELVQTIDGEGRTLLQGDINGDGTADFALLLTGAPALVEADFVL